MGFKINRMNHAWRTASARAVWCVHDTKIAHADPWILNMLIEKKEASFAKLTVTQVKDHNFFMKTNLKEAIEESGLNMTNKPLSQATETLFKVDTNSKPLDK
jgi:lipopolysaccharide biosynthesis protein